MDWREKCKLLIKLVVVLVEDRDSGFNALQEIANAFGMICRDRLKQVKSAKVEEGLRVAQSTIDQWKQKDEHKEFEPAFYRVLLIDSSKTPPNMKAAVALRDTISKEDILIAIVGVGGHRSFEEEFQLASIPVYPEGTHRPLAFWVRHDHNQIKYIMNDLQRCLCPSPTLPPPMANPLNPDSSDPVLASAHASLNTATPLGQIS